MAFDRDRYLERIDYAGSMQPTLDAVTALLQAHMAAIPFENLDVVLGRGVDLELDALQCKLVSNRRGGYCFEHASLFAAALDALGFDVRRHAARVVRAMARDVAPRNHMFLTLHLPEGTFVLDPGFGGGAPRAPLPLEDGAKVRLDRELHWLERQGRHWVMRTLLGDSEADCWIATLEGDNPLDFVVANHFIATHPASPFVKNLMLRALTPDGAVAIMNRDMTVYRGREVQKTRLPDRQALRSVIAQSFGFDLPEIERLRVPSIPEWE